VAGVTQAFEFATGQGMLRIERVYTDINMRGPVADERWRFTDSHGHEHYCQRSEDGDPYPTLTYVPGPEYSCGECRDDHEDYDVSHYECKICHETVEPGTREARNPEARVMTSAAAYLDGQLISRERAEVIINEMLAAEAGDGSTYKVDLS
jgi:hypothetical protein